MQDILLKQLISRKLRIPLTRSGMADVPGTRFIKNRQIDWKEYTGKSEDLPDIVHLELQNLISEFSSKFHEFSDPQYSNTKVIFAYYASNPAVGAEYIKSIEQSDSPLKEQFLELIKWMDKFGVRLFMSPNALVRRSRDLKIPFVDKSNTSTRWLEDFGYIWGLGKVGENRSQRDAYPKSDEEAKNIIASPEETAKLEADNKTIVQVVTGNKNGAWGIFFKKVDDEKLIPVIGTNYYVHSNTHEENSDWVNYDSFGEKSGQHSKFFGVKDAGNGKPAFTYPTSSRFVLTNGEDDPSPRFIHKSEVVNASKELVWNHEDGTQETLDKKNIKKDGDSYIYLPEGATEPIIIPKQQVITKPQELYYLWIKNDGTLWWVPNASRSTIRKGLNPDRAGADSGKPFPLTREQVDHLSLEKGKYFVLSNPNKYVYSWDTLPEKSPEDVQEKEEKMQDYQQKTQLMDKLYDFLSEQPNLEPPGVNLQATKYCIIGPRFKQAANTGEKETIGRMKSHHTHVRDLNPSGSEKFYGIRKEWVVVASEFNQARAEALGKRGLNAAQSMDGLGPISGFPTIFDAVNKAFSTWHINAPPPDEGSLAEAQEAFEHAMQYPSASMNMPQQNQPVNPQLPAPRVGPPVQIPRNQQSYEGVIDDSGEEEPVKVLANNCLNKSAGNILRQIRKVNIC